MTGIPLLDDNGQRDAILRIPDACPAEVTFLASAVGGDGVPRALTCSAGTSRCWPVAEGPDTVPLLVRQGFLNSAKSLALTHLADIGDVVVGRNSGQLWQWEAATGRVLGDPVRHAALRHHGFLAPPLVTLTVGDAVLAFTDAFDGGLLRWRLRAGSPVGVRMGVDTGALRSMATVELADGTAALFSGSAKGRIHRWDPMSGAELAAPIAGCGVPRAMAPAILSDRTTVLCVVNADGVLHRYDALSGDPIGDAIPTGWQPRTFRRRRWPWHGFVTTARCEGRSLVAVAEGKSSVQLWDIVSGAHAGAVDLAGAFISGLATAQLPDGTPLLIVSDSAGRVHRIDLRPRELVAPVVRPHGRVATWVLPTDASDGRPALTVVGALGARTYDRDTGALLAAVDDPWEYGHPFAVSLTAAADGGGLLVAADEEGICRVNVQTGREHPRTDAESGSTMCDVATATLADGRVIAAGAGYDGAFCRWDTATGELVGEPGTEHPISIMSVTTARSPDGAPMFITGCEAGLILRWDAATGQRIGEPLPGDVDFVTDLAVAATSEGRQFLACLAHTGIHRWDPATGEPIGELIPMDGRWRELITYVDQHGIPSVFVIGFTTDVESAGQWRLDTGERVRADLPGTLRAVFRRDGTEMMVLGAPDGSLTIQPLPAPLPPVAAREPEPQEASSHEQHDPPPPPRE